jgi:hypothetical protein
VTVYNQRVSSSWSQLHYSSKLHQHGSRQRARSELLRISDKTQVTFGNHQDDNYQALFSENHQQILSDLQRPLNSLIMILLFQLF